MITKAEIKLVRSLADRRAREEHGLFVAEGEKIIGELLDSHLHVTKIYATDDAFRGRSDVCRVSAAEMERLSMLKTANNSLATVEIPRSSFSLGAARKGLVLALDDVSNPGNMGTLIRLADWFGIEDVVCTPSSADCFNPKVVQATMGAIIRVRVHCLNLAQLLAEAQAEGIPVYGTFLEGEDIRRAELSQNGIIVMGNEGRGISEACAASIGRKLFIPPYPADRRGSESLNVSTAAAIVCAEFRRRNG